MEESDGFGFEAGWLGRYICGKPLCLYYDGEYREDDANFEPCFPIRKEVAVYGASVRTLPGGRGLTLMHRGPYDQLGRSYAEILQQANERKLNLALATHEVNVKGPGLPEELSDGDSIAFQGLKQNPSTRRPRVHSKLRRLS